MNRLSLLVLVLLTACQGSSSVVAPLTAPGATSPLRSRMDSSSSGGCGNYEVGITGKGGKLKIPPFGDGQFGGIVKYASFNSGGAAVDMFTCPGDDNENNAPVPVGFTPDWFCEIELGAYITFGPGDLQGTLYTNSLSSKTDYYLYAYDSNNNLIETYEIGPYRKRRATVKLASPFQNGFSLNAPYVNLEIVHPTQ